MPTIKIIEFDGAEHTITAQEGDTLMQVAVENNIPGIDGDCGGSCACGTCHVFVGEDWLSVLPQADETESGMLDTRPDAQNNSRLACQIVTTNAIDGLTVTLPEMQM